MGKPHLENRQVEHYIAKYADTVFRVSFLYLKNKSDAEDATQETFIKLCDSAPIFHEEQHVKAWLIRVAVNVCKNELKKFWRTRISEIDENYPYIEDFEKKELTTEVLQLPIKYRDVIYLYYYEGYSTDELSNILGQNPSTIRTRLKRGRELLHKNITGGADIA